MPLPIVFENKSWCAALKPPNMLSVPSRDGGVDARDCFGIELQTQVGTRLWPVHRLDFEVSGLMIFAKQAAAHRDANAWFENGFVRKSYAALSEITPQACDPRLHEGFATLPVPPENVELSWSTLLVRGKRRSFVAAHGKEARTVASWRKRDGSRLWQLQPLTGRAHQLRVHMALAGFPILGDALYGSKVPSTPGTIALRAWRLDFSKITALERHGLPEVLRTEVAF